jgi:hypothetical protein
VKEFHFVCILARKLACLFFGVPERPNGLPIFLLSLSGISITDSSSSHDGKWVASDLDHPLWRSRSGRTDCMQLTHASSEATYSFISPDAKRVAYVVQAESDAPDVRHFSMTQPRGGAFGHWLIRSQRMEAASKRGTVHGGRFAGIEEGIRFCKTFMRWFDSDPRLQHI